MKKLLTIVMALMLSFAVTAFAAEDEEMCPSCDKSVCSAPRLCKYDQQKCYQAQPCNVLINICNCGPGTFWNDGDQVGVRVESLTPGVYFDNNTPIKARLFRYKESSILGMTGEDAKLLGEIGDFYDPNGDKVSDEDTEFPNADTVKVKEYGACDFLIWDLDKGSHLRTPLTIDDLEPNSMSDTGIYAFVQNFSTGTMKSANVVWTFDGSLDWFDTDGDQIITPTDFKYNCDLSSGEKIDMVQTKKNYPWTLDVNSTKLGTDDQFEEAGDNDKDGFDAEDKGDYLAIQIPQVRVDWSEVEAADIMGTVAQGNVCILDVKNANDGLCSDCAIICCCPIDLVNLCSPSRDDCIYFPYAIYGSAEDGWLTGIAITNLSSVPIASMSVDFTIVDETGAVFTATKDDFEKQIQSFTVDSLIEDLELEGVAAGNVYIKVEANFDIDGYEFNLYNNGGVSFGAGVLPRACVWSVADNYVDQNDDAIDESLKKQ